MYFKAVLFVSIGTISSALLVMRDPQLLTTLLLITAVWAFARAYYFAFYVIERYVDPSYRFSGLFSLLRYLLSVRPPPQKDRKGTVPANSS
jgi:hypothetical protein